MWPADSVNEHALFTLGSSVPSGLFKYRSTLRISSSSSSNKISTFFPSILIDLNLPPSAFSAASTAGRCFIRYSMDVCVAAPPCCTLSVTFLLKICPRSMRTFTTYPKLFPLESICLVSSDCGSPSAPQTANFARLLICVSE